MVTAQWPPEVASAKHIRTQSRVLVGPPLKSIAALNYQEGNPIQTGVTTVTVDDVYEFTNAIEVSSNISFPSSGALCIEGTLGDNWFSYTAKLNLNYFVGVKRISGLDTFIPTGAPISMFRDITHKVERYELKLQVEDSSFYWKCNINGFKWDSSMLVQDNMLLIQERVWNDLTDIVGVGTPKTYTESVTSDYRDALPWTSWRNRYKGFIDEPNVEGGKNGSKWSMSATGQSKYLKFTQTEARQYGVEKLNVTWIAKTTLEDVGAEPTESVFGSSFAVSNVATNSLNDIYISKEVPTKTTLASRPSGAWDPTTWVKLQTLAIANPESNELSRQRAMLIELYNTYERNADLESEGQAGYHNIILENNYGQRLYFWSQNGYSTGDHFFPAESSLAIFFDQEAGMKIFHVGDGVTPVEIQHLDGFKPGLNPYVTHRSIGKEWKLDPKAGWLAVRAARLGRGSGVQTTSIDSVQCNVVSDSGSTIEVDDTTGFPAFGMVEANNRITNYTSKDGTHFYGCTTVAGNNTTYGVGNTLFQHTFTEWYYDFVSWGNGVDSEGNIVINEPEKFWIQGFNSDVVQDQNGLGFADKVWQYGTRVAGTGSGHASEDGMPVGSCIRRVNAMGGGVAVTGDYPNGGVFNADKHNYEDWEVYAVPHIGNMFSLGTYQWLRGEVGEHEAAQVLEDNVTDWTDDPEDSSILVGPGQARYYPAHLLGQERIKTNRPLPDGSGFYTFVYEYRTDSEFRGVRYVYDHTLAPMATPMSPPLQIGDTLTKIINVAPPGWPVRYEPANLYELQSLAIRRYRKGVAIFCKTDSDTTVVMQGAGGNELPSSGTIYGNYIDLSYTGKSYDSATQLTTLTGVTRLPLGIEITPGDSFEFQPDMSVPTELYFRSSAMRAPMDPTTFLPEGQAWKTNSNNPDWADLVRISGNKSPNLYLVPQFAGPRSYVRYLFLMIGEQKTITTNQNERVKINEIEVFSNVPNVFDNGAILEYAQNPWERTYKTSSIAKQILKAAGVENHQMSENFGGGPSIRTISIAKGSAWRACQQLAKQSQCIFGEDTGGNFVFFPDPRLPGGFGKGRSELVLDSDTILGEPTAKDKPRGEAGQVVLNATNSRANEIYEVKYPMIPAHNGASVNKDSYLVDSLGSAQMLAQYLYRRENQGWTYEANFGQFTKLKPFEVLRIRTITNSSGIAIFDEKQVEFNRDFVVTGIRYITDANGTKSSCEAEELICP